LVLFPSVACFANGWRTPLGVQIPSAFLPSLSRFYFPPLFVCMLVFLFFSSVFFPLTRRTPCGNARNPFLITVSPLPAHSLLNVIFRSFPSYSSQFEIRILDLFPVVAFYPCLPPSVLIVPVPGACPCRTPFPNRMEKLRACTRLLYSSPFLSPFSATVLFFPLTTMSVFSVPFIPSFPDFFRLLPGSSGSPYITDRSGCVFLLYFSLSTPLFLFRPPLTASAAIPLS